MSAECTTRGADRGHRHGSNGAHWHRQLEHPPAIKDVREYDKTWLAWFNKLKAKAGYHDMIKGEGNSIFLLIFTLRWWPDVMDYLDNDEGKQELNERLCKAARELSVSLHKILESSTLELEKQDIAPGDLNSQSSQLE